MKENLERKLEYFVDHGLLFRDDDKKKCIVI